jgi:hypothetical protein
MMCHDTNYNHTHKNMYVRNSFTIKITVRDVDNGT